MIAPKDISPKDIWNTGELLQTSGLEECEGCGGAAVVTILLAVGVEADYQTEYFYIPNQNTLALRGTVFDVVQQVPFCTTCMRAIEDNLRATIARLRESAGEEVAS